MENQYLFGISLCMAFVAWIMSRMDPRLNVPALCLLFVSALLVRVFIIQLDPFLHNWDERYHALVASNMISHPFQPMLRKDAVLPYDVADWTGNHIWLHKQPVFLWLMAGSMKIFGVNEIAARMPSALLGAISTLILWRMGSLIFNKETGWIEALLFTFCNFQLEQTSGVIGMDHNDVCFTFFITLSFWTFLEFEKSKKIKWICLTGLFSGLAVLNKWLPGLLIYSVWMIRIIQTNSFILKKYPWKQLAISTGICLLTFVPWQIYILMRFPVESRLEFQYNTAHLQQQVENHGGNLGYYFLLFNDYFNYWLLIPFAIGLTGIFLKKQWRTGLPLIYGIAVIYIFFTFFVATKMISYAFCVAPLVMIVIAAGISFIWEKITSFKLNKLTGEILLFAMMFISVVGILQFNVLSATHKRHGSKYVFENRSVKIANTNAYRSLKELPVDYDIIFNCKAMEETEAMFYSQKNVYAYYPDSVTVDSLIRCGYKLAVLSKTNNQPLPAYMINNSKIDKLEISLK